jgi:hydroxymethylpyrimidine pyrophosphatase-like HAD family hydrolase
MERRMVPVKIIAFDLDDVLCQRDPNIKVSGIEKYDHCEPIQKNIDIVNSLYDDGHKIIIYTARGMTIFSDNVSQIYENLYPKTYDCLIKWGIKFHQLVMGKISYDVLIDDKCLNSVGIDKESITKFLS